MHAIGPLGDDLANRAIMDSLHRFLERLVMAAHQPSSHFEVLPRGFLARFEHPANPRRIDRKRFFHENVHSFLHGIFEVNWPESRWGGEQHLIAFVEAVDSFTDSFEAKENA